MRVSRSGPRRAAVALLGAAALAALAAPSAGARTDVALSGAVTPALRGFPTTPQNVALTLEGRIVGDDIEGEYPATSRRMVLEFTHGARVNGALFPSCSPARLSRMRGARRACPRGSRIGGGYAFGTAITVTVRLRMDVYNGPGGRSMLFFFAADNPITIRDMIVAPFRAQPRHPAYGFRLTLPIPPGLQSLGPGMETSLRQFRARVGGMRWTGRVGGRRVRRGFIEAMTCPPGALVAARGTFEFIGAPTRTVSSHLGCGSAPPFPAGFPPSVAGSG